MADNSQSPCHVDIPHRYRSFQALFPTCRPQYTVFPTAFLQALSMTRSGPHKDDPPTFEPLPDNIFSRQTHPSWHEAYACCTRLFFWAVGRQPPPGAALYCMTCAPGYSDTSSWRRPQSADETGCARKPSAAQMSRHSRSWPRMTFSPSTLWHSRQMASTSS
jgi:hypothetical protein